MSLTALDLFSGAGGLSLGFEKAGFRVENAADNWIDALETLKLNKPQTNVHLVDMSDKLLVDDLIGRVGSPTVVIGGPPCQGFSIAGKRNPNDPRNRLYEGFVGVIQDLRPQAFIMENVPTISSPSNRELFDAILRDFGDLGYSLHSKVLLASEFGVPQNRKRMFIVGFREGVNFAFPKPMERPISSFEALSDLPELSVSDGERYSASPLTEFQREIRSGSNGIWNHQITNHSAQTIKVIDLVPDGGNYKDLPEEYRSIRNVNIAWTRLASSRPSFTVDTGHRHHFHYKFNRVPTVRESARLQSFPDSFVFLGSRTSQMRQVGNAVPPRLAEVVARSVRQALEGGTS